VQQRMNTANANARCKRLHGMPLEHKDMYHRANDRSRLLTQRDGS